MKTTTHMFHVCTSQRGKQVNLNDVAASPYSTEDVPEIQMLQSYC